MNNKLLGLFTIVLLGTTAIVNPAFGKVGVTTAVNGQPRSIPPQENERILTIGNDIVADEIITSRVSDKTQVVFQDGSTLTVGPNSVVKVDKFVYDPNSKAGTLNLNASKGVFRYVGGTISKSSEVSVKTPSATMGIRGGIVSFTVAADGTLVANFLFGKSLTITAQGVTVTTTQPGTMITVKPGQAPGQPEPIPPGMLQELDRSFHAGGPNDNSQKVEFDGSIIAKSNSDMSPEQARAAIDETKEKQLNVANAEQGSGPLQTAGPLQGSDTLENGGPLQSSGPLQAAGPLQNAGPLAAASPLQQTGPVMGNFDMGAAGTQPGMNMPYVPVQQASFIPYTGGINLGDTNSIQQIASFLSSPQASNPEALSTVVNNVTYTPSPTPTTIPSVLPPTVYNPGTSSNVSPN